MKTNLKSTGAFASLILPLSLALMGAAGCSNDNPSSSTPDLFTPKAGTTEATAPLTLSAAPEAPMPSKDATLFLINVKLNLENVKDADFFRNEIVNCVVLVSSAGQDLLPGGSHLLDSSGVSPCRAGEKSDDFGAFLVGTPKKSGSLAFTIKMFDVTDKVTAQGKTAELSVQPNGTVTQDLVATPVP